MKIAILGTRGVPPRYGGFETFAAELSVRLVARGHEVLVYSRADRRSPFAVRQTHAANGSERSERAANGERFWNGVERIVLPSVNGKYFETVSHSLFSAIDALRRGFDAILICNAANAFVLPLLRAARIPVAINVDGIERRRRKWNVLGRAVYAVGESFSARFANRVVADAEVIADYYRRTLGVEPIVIPYGADFPDERDSDVLERLGVKAGGYVLYVSRFEPENNPLEVVRAYEKTATPMPLLMVGEGLYAPELVRELHARASERVRFPGAIYGADYRTLQRNAGLYIQATEVGGTHPALIEAMGSGGAVIAHDTPENREVGGDAVRYFKLRPEETLSPLVTELLGDSTATGALREAARRRVAERYRWDAVTDEYERLFSQLTS